MFSLLKCKQVKNTAMVIDRHLITDTWWKHLIETEFKLTKKAKKMSIFANAFESSISFLRVECNGIDQIDKKPRQ